ncbi:MAG TPA: hypothetical protein VLJ41_03820, partial [Segetibacter sp.]|nr:hypothetical protein [Segetibacter sp.]
MKASLIISLFFTLFQMQAYGCDCVYNGPFKEMSKHVEFVSLVKVTRFLSFKNIDGVQMPLAMQAKIIRTYKGKEKRTTITIWGDNGNLCRPYL